MTTVDRPIVSRELFGRATELSTIEGAVAQARSGHGQVLLIAGEAGIGKTRLVAESRSRALAAGLSVLEGGCFEADRVVPFAPFVDLLREWIDGPAGAEAADVLGPSAGVLLTILPELAQRLPATRPFAPLEPAQERRRIVRAIGSAITRMAERRPLLVAIEDAHWADEASLDVLSVIARSTAADRILLVVTFRPDEAAASLRRVLAEVDREPRATELRPAGLGFDDAGAMLRGLLDLRGPVPGAFLAVIHALTEGNPFFIEEVTRSLVATGDLSRADGDFTWRSPGEIRVPRTVEEAVRRRSDRVSRSARDVLSLAAVAGLRSDPALLEAISGRSEEDIVEALRELIDAQLIVEESADRFSFRHALTRQAVYSALLLRERRALHRSIAETLERTDVSAADDHLGDLAYHFHEAAMWHKAIAYASRAGERARALYAPRSAVEQFDRAVHAAHELGIPPEAEVLRSRGLAYETLGDLDSARADLEAACERARAAGDHALEWRTTLDLGLLWASSDYGRAGALLERALALARTMGEPRAIASSLDRMGNQLVNVGRTAEGLRAHDEALAIFRASGDEQGVAGTLDLLGMARGIHGDVATATTEYRAAIELLRTLGDSDALVSSLASHALWASPTLAEVTSSGRATPDEQANESAEALALAKRIGSAAAEAYAEWTTGLARAGFGEFGEALAHGESGLRIATEIGHPQWVAAARFTLGHTCLLILDIPAAARHLTEALRLAGELGSAWWTYNASASLAMAHLRAGEAGAAVEVLDRARPAEREALTLAERRMSHARAQIAAAAGDHERALEVVDGLLTSAGADGDHPIPALERTRALSLSALDRHADALRAAAAAEKGALERHERSLLWRAIRARAEILASSGEAELAREAYGSARAAIDEVAATLPDERARDRFVRSATASLPRPAGRGRGAATPAHTLTPRETEVALLIAEGLSNRAIAEKLFVGERTVEAHVSSILAKLGRTSRAQIAVWAVTEAPAPGRP